MKINKITVQATRSTAHPSCGIAVIISSLVLHADLEETDPLENSVKLLQAKAEDLAEQHLECLGNALQAYLGLTSQQPSAMPLEAEIILAQDRNALAERANATRLGNAKPRDIQ